MKERYGVRVELRRIAKNGPERIIKQEDKEYELIEDALEAYAASTASNSTKREKVKP